MLDDPRQPLAVEVEQRLPPARSPSRGRPGRRAPRPPRAAARRRDALAHGAVVQGDGRLSHARRTSASAPGWIVLPLAEVHVHAARQARVEAADRAHDVDAAEVVRAVLLEDRLAHAPRPRRARGTVGVRRAAVPRRRRVRVVVGDLAVADHQVVREHAAHRLVEAAADRLVGDVEVLEDLRAAPRGPRRTPGRGSAAPSPPRRRRSRSAPGRARSRSTTAGSSTRASAPAVSGVLGRLISTLVARGVDVRRVDLVGQRRRPQARERAAAGVERQVVARALVVPARAHHPGVVAAVEVALLRLGDRRLVPRVALVDRVAERVLGDERLLADPVVVVGWSRAGSGCRG